MNNIYKMYETHNFDIIDYNDDSIIIDNQDIDDVTRLTPKYIIEYVVERYKHLYQKFEKIINNAIQNGFEIGYNRVLTPYIELYIFEDEFYDLNFDDTQIFGKFGNKSCATPAWLTKLSYIICNEQKISNGEINVITSFSLNIDSLKNTDNRYNWIYNMLLDFLEYIKENVNYMYGSCITPENIYKESYFTISTLDYNEHIFYMLKNALDIFEKYTDFLNKHLLNYMKNSLNEDLQEFNIEDYRDDSIIDDQTINNVLIIPKTTDDLYRLIAERLKKDPKNPYLLDIDTSHIKDMRALFSPFIIGGELKGNYYIFRNEYKLDPYNIKNIDIHTWDTSNVTDMSFMFYECRNLESINLSGIDTSNVRSMANMFDSCETIKNINLSKLNMSNVRNFSRMFNRCLSLENIDISGCNTKNIRDVANMFNNCKNIKNIKLSKSLAGKLLTYHLQDELPLYRNEQLGIDELPYKINVI